MTPFSAASAPRARSCPRSPASPRDTRPTRESRFANGSAATSAASAYPQIVEAIKAAAEGQPGEAFRLRACAFADAAGKAASEPLCCLFLAGGTELLNWMRLGVLEPETVIDISALAGGADIYATRVTSSASAHWRR